MLASLCPTLLFRGQSPDLRGEASAQPAAGPALPQLHLQPQGVDQAHSDPEAAVVRAATIT